MSECASSVLTILTRMEEKLDKLLMEVEEGKKYQSKPPDWWKWENLKVQGGYAGVSLSMSLYYHGRFDKVKQWASASGVPRSTVFLVRDELKDHDVIKRAIIELTCWGERACKVVDTLPVPVFSKSKFFETVETIKLQLKR